MFNQPLRTLMVLVIHADDETHLIKNASWCQSNQIFYHLLVRHISSITSSVWEFSQYSSDGFSFSEADYHTDNARPSDWTISSQLSLEGQQFVVRK